MRYSLLFLLFLSFISVSAKDSIQHIPVQSCQIAGPVFLQKPVLSDTVNIFGKQYDAQQILKTKISPDAFRRNAKTISVDTTGYFTINHTLTEHASLYFFNFTVTASAFAKAKLKVTSPQAFEMYVNDEKTTEKTSVQKSIEKALSAEWSPSLEPRAYNVTVKCLLAAGDTLPPSVKMAWETTQPAKLDIADMREKRPFTLNDVLEGERPSSISVSADGKYALLRSAVTLPKDGEARTLKYSISLTTKSF